MSNNPLPAMGQDNSDMDDWLIIEKPAKMQRLISVYVKRAREMAFKLFDVVTTTEALPESGIGVGMTGTVVDVYQDGAVEVEFCNKDGETIAMVPLRPSQIALADIRKADCKVPCPVPICEPEDVTLENLAFDLA